MRYVLVVAFCLAASTSAFSLAVALDLAKREAQTGTFDMHGVPVEWLHLALGWSCGLALAVTAMLLLASNRRRRTQQTAALAGEAGLLAANRLLDAVFASTQDCIKVLDPDGIILSINKAACRKLGIDRPDQVVGRAWDGLWCEDRSGQVRDAMAQARLGRVARLTAPTPHESGTLRWWNVLITPVFGPNGSITQLIAVSRDVTGARPGETALNGNEARLRSIVDTALEGVIVATIGGSIISANPAGLRMFGYMAETDLIGRDLAVLMSPQDAGLHGGHLAAHRAGGPARAIGSPGRELLARRRDGTMFPITLSVTSFTADGQQYVTGIIRDASERKQAEAALRGSEAMVRLAVRSAALGIWEYDDAQNTLCLDERASEVMCGVIPAGGPVRADGPEFAEFERRVHRDNQASRRAAFEAVRSGQADTLEVTYRFRRDDGLHLWLTSRGAVVERYATSGRARRIVGVIMDVTDRIEAETRLEMTVRERTRALAETAQELRAEMQRRVDTQAALIHAQKMKALGQLTGGVVHDCNNVLCAINIFFELIGRYAGDDRVRDLARDGNLAAARAIGIVKHLLAFTRQERVRPIRINTQTLILDSKDLIRLTLGANIELATDAAPDLWPVLADKHRLEVALINLSVNAHDAMPNGGSLTLSARNLPGGAPRPAAVPQGDCVVIAVTDTGCGMPPDILARVTEPFFTTKSDGNGTGLGLAMVREFSQESNGALTISSEFGEGTTVEIYLPRATQDVDDVEETTTGPDMPANGLGRTVLVVDDDDLVRTTTAGVLEALGYRIMQAADAEAACEVVHSVPELEIVISEIQMVGVDGLVLASRLKLDHPDLPVVFTGGSTATTLPPGCKLLPKPFNGAALASFVASNLRSAA